MNNPYEAPKSDVRDVEPQRVLAERPRQVVYATLCFWLSFLISIPLMYWELAKAPEEPFGATVAGFVLLFLVLIFMAIASVAVWRGRNWARIVFLIFSALSVVGFVLELTELRQSSAIEIVLSVVSTGLDVAVSYLLFTQPGALWFRTLQSP